MKRNPAHYRTIAWRLAASARCWRIGIPLWLLWVTVFGPTAALHGQKEIHLHKDFNRDGRKDSLGCTYDGGSGFGGFTCTVRDGKTKEVFEMNTFHCFCRTKYVVLIPPPLLRKENRPFLERMQEQLFPQLQTTIDPSLQWIISSTFGRKELPDDPFFDYTMQGTAGWLPGPCRVPAGYTLRVQGDTLDRLYSTDAEVPDWYTPGTARGYLYYAGLQHRLLENQSAGDTFSLLIDSNALYSLHVINHGVWVEKNGRYKWIFITDKDINDAPDKMRWASIWTAQLIDDLVLIVQQLPTGSGIQVYLADIETGVCGHFRDGLWLSAGDMPAGRLVNPSDGIFRLRHEGTTLSVSTEEMRKALLSAH